MAQISFRFNGGFWLVSLPLFQGIDFDRSHGFDIGVLLF